MIRYHALRIWFAYPLSLTWAGSAVLMALVVHAVRAG